ncbi:hypothetical protein FN846DRAFT_889974 [Sphaerosporella brunnea]|uniref:Uncharacterized protein n=1 Tax=Sphaerosporella brunnea TaxID=1250544 RepID=A0A5J5EY48_9PEZI|nr:hypothetical protein FN846DRAFT_889974 [Sphaerosporella brunnea]
MCTLNHHTTTGFQGDDTKIYWTEWICCKCKFYLNNFPCNYPKGLIPCLSCWNKMCPLDSCDQQYDGQAVQPKASDDDGCKSEPDQEQQVPPTANDDEGCESGPDEEEGGVPL